MALLVIRSPVSAMPCRPGVDQANGGDLGT
jgi:hypothetical protein